MTVGDVGARRGAKDDFSMIASGVDYVLFEPDEEEAEALRCRPAQPYQSVTVETCALSDREESFPLNLYRQRGCSSRLMADSTAASRFQRDSYFLHEGAVDVSATTLDSLVDSGRISEPDFLKVDVQGMEPEVLRGADRCIRHSLVGARLEVSFYPLYENQPLVQDVDALLRPHGFVPMCWIELHEWRRATRSKYPEVTRDEIPLSRGQMMHGDILYLLEPEALPNNSNLDRKRLVHLAMAACCYRQFDHAIAAFTQPGVRTWVIDSCGVDPVDAVSRLSKSAARREWASRQVRRLARRIGGWKLDSIP